MHTYNKKNERNQGKEEYKDSSSTESASSFTVTSCKSDSGSCSYSESRSVDSERDDSDNILVFRPLITPLTDIIVTYGKNAKCPTFTLLKNNNIITLTWEPFNGKISETGIENLFIHQTIKWLPSCPLELPIVMYHKEVRYSSLMSITLDSRYQLKFVFPKGLCIKSSDNVRIPGGCVSWVH